MNRTSSFRLPIFHILHQISIKCLSGRTKGALAFPRAPKRSRVNAGNDTPVRMNMILCLAAMIGLFAAEPDALASHNRAGEITYRWLYGTTYEIMVVTYTKDDSPADRCELEVYWGDGGRDTLPRSNGDINTKCALNVGEGVFVGNNTRRNEYVGVHTYPGPGIYRITMMDQNRNGNVTNMFDSFETPFFVFLTFNVGTNTNGMDTNSSPVILNPPIDAACSGKLFVHNAGAYDVNGDSISYELGDCYQGLDHGTQNPVEALGYWIPDDISIDPVTGDLIWNTPPPVTPINTGRGYDEYNICFEIIEWKGGAIVGRIQRDMQITVWPCENEPPVITASDTCVLAGDTVNLHVSAVDPDSSGSNPGLTLTASGGPLIIGNSPAVFTPDSSPSLFTASGDLVWHSNCSHVRKQPYTVTFKAEDNDADVSLVDMETIAIQVIGPAPTGLQSSAVGNNIELNWNVSACTDAIGYRIYRRNGPYGGTIECPCETGVPVNAGYTLLTSLTGLNTVNYTDDANGAGLIHGIDYCYRVVAYFPDGAESCASDESCSQLKLDVPVITHVSVGFTNDNTGRDTVIWAMPKILNTAQYPGPYHYDIYQSPDFNTAATLIASTPAMASLPSTDTVFLDLGLNTEAFPHSYKIELFSGTDPVGFTHVASSIFLSIASNDNRLDLSWQVNNPWTNSVYYIYRFNDLTSNFDLIDSTTSTAYSDSGLVNGMAYCYFVKSAGSYSVPGIVNPIVNYSQQTCGIPIDRTPPCAPALEIAVDCDAVENTLAWNNPNNSCADDVMHYNVYYTPLLGGELTYLQAVSPAVQTTLLLNNLSSLAGCYAVSAVDSFSNESILSDSVCVDNCPLYELPNVFSPDGNSLNDRFTPFPYKFVDKIDIKIYDRWGQLVFETTDPDINWDGKYYKNHQDVAEGVFYYVCYVDVIRLRGIETEVLTGFIHLLRSLPGNTN